MPGRSSSDVGPQGKERCGERLAHARQGHALRNDYEREVFNGDIGRVAAADPESGQVTVNFDGRSVAYRSADFGTLAPAYVLSVHKTHGAEFPAVIVPLFTRHFPLGYTAVARGKSLVVLVGRESPADSPAKWQAPLAPLTVPGEACRRRQNAAPRPEMERRVAAAENYSGPAQPGYTAGGWAPSIPRSSPSISR